MSVEGRMRHRHRRCARCVPHRVPILYLHDARSLTLPRLVILSPIPGMPAGEDPKLPPLFHRQKREQQLAAKQRREGAGASAPGASQQGRNGSDQSTSPSVHEPSEAEPSGGGGGRGGEGGAAHAEASARPSEATPAVELEYVWGVYEVRITDSFAECTGGQDALTRLLRCCCSQAIAPHFSATRFAVWPAVRTFLEGLAEGLLRTHVAHLSSQAVLSTR